MQIEQGNTDERAVVTAFHAFAHLLTFLEYADMIWPPQTLHHPRQYL